MVRFLRGFFVVLAVAALTLSAGLVFAQAAPLPVPISIQPVAATPTGLQTMATFDARGIGGAANAGYYTRPVLVSNNTLGGLARGLMRRAVPVAAMIAAVEAMGWAIDELTGQVMDGPVVPQTAPPGTSYVVTRNKYFPDFGTAGAWTIAYFNQAFPSRAPWTYQGLTQCGTPSSSGSYTCKLKIQDGVGGSPGYETAVYYPNNNPGSTINFEPFNWPQPVTDPQLGQVVRDNPNLWNDALRNPDGSVNRNPDVMNEAERLRDALTNPDPATNPQPNPDAEWDTGYQGGQPQPNGQQAPQPWPAICEWAPNICSWLDWTQQEPIFEDEDDGLPLETVDPLEEMPEFNPGLGYGACPAPQEVNTFVGTISVPFDIFCQLAQTLAPLVLAAAWLTGAMIIVGLRRG